MLTPLLNRLFSASPKPVLLALAVCSISAQAAAQANVTQNFNNPNAATAGELTFSKTASALSNGGEAGYFQPDGTIGAGAYGVSNESGAPNATNNFLTLDFGKKTFAATSTNNFISFDLASVNNGTGNSSKGINNSTRIEVFLNINNTGNPNAGSTAFPAVPQFTITGDVANGPNFAFNNGASYTSPSTVAINPTTTVTYTVVKANTATHASRYTLKIPSNSVGGTSVAMRMALSSSGNTTVLIDNVQYVSGTAAPLPVELTRFEAAAKGSAVGLSWATASEKNSAYFEVQRSATGEAYEAIGKVAAQGNSSSLHAYDFTDAHPLASLAYYRLRQVDTDGSAAYSPVATARRASEFVTIYPNPTTDAVLLPASLGTVRYRVLNGLGQALASGQASGGDRLDVSALPKGSFFLELTDATGRHTQRLVRQ